MKLLQFMIRVYPRSTLEFTHEVKFLGAFGNSCVKLMENLVVTSDYNMCCYIQYNYTHIAIHAVI